MGMLHPDLFRRMYLEPGAVAAASGGVSSPSCSFALLESRPGFLRSVSLPAHGSAMENHWARCATTCSCDRLPLHADPRFALRPGRDHQCLHLGSVFLPSPTCIRSSSSTSSSSCREDQMAGAAYVAGYAWSLITGTWMTRMPSRRACQLSHLLRAGPRAPRPRRQAAHGPRRHRSHG